MNEGDRDSLPYAFDSLADLKDEEQPKSQKDGEKKEDADDQEDVVEGKPVDNDDDGKNDEK